MRILNNKKIKQTTVVCVLIQIFFILLLLIMLQKMNTSYKKNMNYTIANIINTVHEKYPNIQSEEIAEILNKKNSDLKAEYVEDILRMCGVSSEDYLILTEINEKNHYVVLITSIVIISYISIMGIIFIYLRGRQKSIYNLSQYIDKILNKEYVLKIEENSEDELSNLKNQLYKITVMLQEEAGESVKQKEETLKAVSDISHQLKTPLTSALILLDNIYENPVMEEETRKKFIVEITHQVEEMNWLIVSILKLSRIDANVVEFKNVNINVKKLIDTIVSELEIIAELKNVKFKKDFSEDFAFIGDFNWNKEAIKNIVKNAIEYTKQNSTITIKVLQNNVYTEISIQDQGKGIDSKDITHIFERFYKSKNSSENSIGIGLALSKSIIEKQNGNILVDSKLNEGTKFIIRYLKY